LFCVTYVTFYSAGVSIRVARRVPGWRTQGEECRSGVGPNILTPEKLGWAT
jgi:hypothetical protein